MKVESRINNTDYEDTQLTDEEILCIDAVRRETAKAEAEKERIRQANMRKFRFKAGTC